MAKFFKFPKRGTNSKPSLEPLEDTDSPVDFAAAFLKGE